MSDEEKRFTLIAMKYVFKLCNCHLPDKYQKELNEFDENLPILFTENMKKAIATIIDEFFGDIKPTINIESEEYKKELEKLENDFDLGSFLKFMAWYLLESAFEKSEEKRAKVYNDIIKILKSKIQISHTWIVLDEFASRYVKTKEAEGESVNYIGSYNFSMVEDNEEKHFTLIAMKYVFELCKCHLPDKYQKELNDIDENLPILFTENMEKAMATISDEFFGDITSTNNIESEEYEKALEKLENDFDLESFLKFMGWYLLESAFEKSEEKRAKVYNDIIKILKSKTQISHTWIVLDNVASRYVETKDSESQSVNYIGSYNFSMVEDKKFLLKVIDCVFSLHFRTLPKKLQVKVNNILPRDNDPFTDNVAHALSILLDNQQRVITKLGEKGLVDHYFNFMCRSFNGRDFLEFCASQSRKAVLEFVYNFEDNYPYETYKRMKRLLKDAKRAGRFTGWDSVEEAAVQLIQDDIHRREDELLHKKLCKLH